ncbi:MULTISPECIES: SCO3374 family protein [unclassified Streptomyces]|uniref:SCO3374 family protein n=1 Tax=unclassified Streptomyces TaxID=2593676 RepID=UPI0006AFC318|nr:MULTISPECIES: SCO3374 family protein [unclassified Streptomyces]KOX25047.1 proline-rich protein [Streptomyces sp. NRRL F-6491]KOX39676.1 proline-rich protein [Streptomyces sp. NRRL F-6492]
MAPTVPSPRAPIDDDPARWYEDELGWATLAGPPVALATGLRFDVLELPAAAGRGVLRRVGAATGPAALAGHRMRLLVAAGSAEELPGLLDWLEWGGIALDLAVLGPDGRMTAPLPPGRGGSGAPDAAVWLRAPVPGREVESSLPVLRAAPWGAGGGPPCLVRLVAAAAAECHRVRLLSARARGPAAQQLPPQRFASS